MQLSRRLLISITALLVITTMIPGLARADDPNAFRKIITEQIAAFGVDDGTAAFSYASPGVRSKFGTPERFMDMVRSGYSPVYRPKSFNFGAVTREFGGRPTQRVVFIDQSGRLWTALYAFERQSDGDWKIDGVAFTRTDEVVS